MKEIYKLELGPGFPAMGLAWSPDGHSLATASTTRLFVFSVEQGRQPRLRLMKEFRPSTGSNPMETAANGEADGTPPSLSWTPDSSRVAFGRNTQVCNRLYKFIESALIRSRSPSSLCLTHRLPGLQNHQPPALSQISTKENSPIFIFPYVGCRLEAMDPVRR